MGYIEDLANREKARQEANALRNAEASRVLNQGTPSVGLAGMMAEPYARGMSAEDEYKLALAKKAQEDNYRRANEAMKNAPVSGGVVDPNYWPAAQKASEYELRGLADRFGR